MRSSSSIAMLAVFLLAQSSSICLPLCWAGVHHEIAAAPTHQHTAVKPCHSDSVRIEAPALPSLGTMLPTRWAPSLPSTRVVRLMSESPKAVHLRPLPGTDPPPPRSI
ncbi:MAG TPA: hypothetical protein VIM84_13430 [Gemmatimonadales bacterium]